jgi:4-amino-4-deoxy-L-arabinose transferase-like glycosyltransferase
MGNTTQEIPLSTPLRRSNRVRQHQLRARRLLLRDLAVILAFWLLVFVGSLATPSVLDDADATHAQAAEAMLQTGDLVTLHVDGIRYLEKAPLPYWISALSLRLLNAEPPLHGGRAAFALHLPLALTVLGLALLGYIWSRRAFGELAALYTAVFVLTSAGVFLFTRVFIPDALLSLLLALSLFFLLRALELASSIATAYAMWAMLALAVLAKGLVALVFFFASALIFLLLTGELCDRNCLRRLRPASGAALMLAIAAPWHILAGLRNTGGDEGHGFFWFYFINEHVLRFLGRRIPADFNKLPFALYWSLHLVWLFPWSFFAPACLWFAFRQWKQRKIHHNLLSGTLNAEPIFKKLTSTFAGRTILLLSIFIVLVLIFFSLSTNQEYYTFPVYLPVLMLISGGLVAMQSTSNSAINRCAFSITYGLFTLACAAIAIVLACGLWSSRSLPFVRDIGDVLAHRGVGDYTLSMSHLFDLTGPSFAALRFPAALAAAVFAIGPITAWILHIRHKPIAALFTVACTSAAFLIAAHVAFVRFEPMLSSRDFAETILRLEHSGAIEPDAAVMIYGDQAFGSSMPFYLGHPVQLVDGRTTSMLFGSTFADVPPVFLTHHQLLAQWGIGRRKILFVPLEQREVVDHLLGHRQFVLNKESGKALLTDRPLEASSR